MKIGILGGTFNPIHIGHLILAEEVREKRNLDRIIFVPTYLPPHKDNSDIIAARDRYNMIKLAIKTNRYFSVSDIEIKRDGRSYTIDTIKEFKKIYPKDELYFISGSDLLKYLDDWKDVDEIIRMVKFIVATRPGYPLEKIPAYPACRQAGISTVAIRAVDVSAFEIRRAIKENRSFRYLVPESVLRYINKKRLYR
jgi:nicotinate-nucleotide adenylyltransferase